MLSDNPAPQFLADVAAHAWVCAREIEQSLREIVGIVSSEPKPYGQASEELVERGVVRQDRQPHPTRFQTTLSKVFESRACVALRSASARTEQLRYPLPWSPKAQARRASQQAGERRAEAIELARDEAAQHPSAEALVARDARRARAQRRRRKPSSSVS